VTPDDSIRLAPEDAAAIDLILTPHGHVILVDAEGAPPVDRGAAARLGQAFAGGTGSGLLQLGAGEVDTPLPPTFAYWRDFAARYVTLLCTHPDAAGARGGSAAPAVLACPDEAELDAIVAAAPPMIGAEYVTPDGLRGLWTSLGDALTARIAATKAPVQDALRSFHPAWNTVGRVHFHLAENRKDPDAPFAFMATYSHGLSAHATTQHLPLGQALREYAGAASKARLLSLLLPVQRASAACAWLKAMVDSGEIYHPLRWTPRDALALLRDARALEQAGIIVRVPEGWKAGRPPRPTVQATVGTRPPAGLGLDALLDFRMDVTLEGERLTPDEIRALLEGVDGLAILRGRWVEVDRERLRGLIDEFRRAERTAAIHGLTFAEAMRLVSGATSREATPTSGDDREWSGTAAGPWLSGVLEALRAPGSLARVDPGEALHGTLRPYQQVGVRWLHLLSSLGLGACLADDMGLGKTIQVLALLLVLDRERVARGNAAREPSLIVAPASLLANWAAEVARFAPGLSILVAHPSAMPAGALKGVDDARVQAADLVVTTYGAVRRLPWISERRWHLVVADEAQAIKNPDARQTRAVKALQARARIALTGTPIENRLGDLWSIFDFINPGLLGSAKQFTALTRRLAERPHYAYAPLRDLVRPYILRRMKTDRTVIADLPDKTEVNAYCLLSRTQAALYEQAVQDLRDRLAAADGIERRGVVLASLMRLKQICNHPSQWLGDGAWRPADSGKWGRLSEVAEVIAARQEKVLVFTQFREITAPIAAHLGAAFGRPGLVLHGGTPIRQRRELVRQFQEDERTPFFVLSLKAGGSGLNLTAATHVVHFDRWWNPAVEDQATDRAFRIGQTRNVLVHKFVCRGTVEERIDELIASKRGLARDVLEGGADLMLTEMANDDLLRLVALDHRAALSEA
jgi:superfamily II DNA or RNA helicase